FPSLVFDGSIQVVKYLNSDGRLRSETPQQQVGSFLQIEVNATGQAFIEESEVNTNAGLRSRFPFQSGVHRSLCSRTRDAYLTVSTYTHVRVALSADILSVSQTVLVTYDTIADTEFKSTEG